MMVEGAVSLIVPANLGTGSPASSWTSSGYMQQDALRAERGCAHRAVERAKEPMELAKARGTSQPQNRLALREHEGGESEDVKVAAVCPADLPQAHRLLDVEHLALEPQEDRAEEDCQRLLPLPRQPASLSPVG